MVPGRKLPKLPPIFRLGQVEYSLAKLVKEAPSEIFSIIMVASSSLGTRMCRAVALTPSGGAEY